MLKIIGRLVSISLLLIYCNSTEISHVIEKEVAKRSADEVKTEPFISIQQKYPTVHRRESETSDASAHGTSNTSGHESTTSHSTSASEASGHEEGGHDSHSHVYYAILFPWFIISTGIVVFYFITRFCHFVPYTAVLFLIGTLMGIGITNSPLNDQLTASIKMWENINSELLLLTFLPGLLFKDAYGLDFHLFTKAFGQILIMAFPMVLAGTYLMSLVGQYILPYGWNFNLAMTFGAILSATDPVAVSALLNEVGAPPR